MTTTADRFRAAEEALQIEALTILAERARRIASDYGVPEPSAILLDDSDQGDWLTVVGLGWDDETPGTDAADDAYTLDDAAGEAASNLTDRGVLTYADAEWEGQRAPSRWPRPLAASLALIDAFGYDPRPKHAAALVDPEPVPDASPWKDDGPDKDDVAAYVARNLRRRAADDDQAGQNTRRAACALSVVLDYGSKYVGDDVPAAILGDLLADLRHAADALGLDYTDLDATADRRYTEEAVHGEPWGEL